jgi:hypothetical protein
MSTLALTSRLRNAKSKCRNAEMTPAALQDQLTNCNSPPILPCPLMARCSSAERQDPSSRTRLKAERAGYEFDHLPPHNRCLLRPEVIDMTAPRTSLRSIQSLPSGLHNGKLSIGVVDRKEEKLARKPVSERLMST